MGCVGEEQRLLMLMTCDSEECGRGMEADANDV